MLRDHKVADSSAKKRSGEPINSRQAETKGTIMNTKHQIRIQIIDFKKGISLGTMNVNVSEEYYEQIRSLSGYNAAEYGLEVHETLDQPVYLSIKAVSEEV